MRLTASEALDTIESWLEGAEEHDNIQIIADVLAAVSGGHTHLCENHADEDDLPLIAWHSDFLVGQTVSGTKGHTHGRLGDRITYSQMPLKPLQRGETVIKQWYELSSMYNVTDDEESHPRAMVPYNLARLVQGPKGTRLLRSLGFMIVVSNDWEGGDDETRQARIQSALMGVEGVRFLHEDIAPNDQITLPLNLKGVPQSVIDGTDDVYVNGEETESTKQALALFDAFIDGKHDGVLTLVDVFPAKNVTTLLAVPESVAGTLKSLIASDRFEAIRETVGRINAVFSKTIDLARQVDLTPGKIMQQLAGDGVPAKLSVPTESGKSVMVAKTAKPAGSSPENDSIADAAYSVVYDPDVERFYLIKGYTEAAFLAYRKDRGKPTKEQS